MSIDIRVFDGVVTNADSEDLTPEQMTDSANLKYVNGKLVKDYGFGVKINVAIQ